jgi:rhamnosyltransferase
MEFNNIRNVAGIVVTYNPNISILSRVLSIAIKQVSCMVIVDNNSNNFEEISSICKEPKFIIMRSDRNLGTSGAYNMAYESLKTKLGIEWVLFLDQDTVLEPDYVELLFEECNKINIPDKIWIMRGLEQITGKERKKRSHKQFKIVRTDTMSGSLIKMEALSKIRFRDEFFLDHVDTDFFNKVWKSNHLAIRFNDITMMHSLGKTINFQGRPTTYHGSARDFQAARNITILILEGYIELRPIWFTIVSVIPSIYIEGFRISIGQFIKGIWNGYITKINSVYSRN